MSANTEKRFSETFIVWDDEINLVAALIPSENGQSAISLLYFLRCRIVMPFQKVRRCTIKKPRKILP
jgi:hypothetical protein